MKRKKLLATHPAVIAVWAAVTVLVGFVPTTPIIGTRGRFDLSMAFYPLAGIFFGPWAGAICAAIAAFIEGPLIPPPPLFGPISFVIPAIAALVTGLAVQKRWIWPLVAILAPNLLWYILPLGREAWFYPLIELLGILAIAVGWVWGGDWLRSENRTKMFAGIFVAALTHCMVDHSWGNLIALNMFALPKEIWLAALPIAPVERISFALGAAIIGVPLLVGLPKVGIAVGPKMYE